jgi:hypothetical protein
MCGNVQAGTEMTRGMLDVYFARFLRIIAVAAIAVMIVAAVAVMYVLVGGFGSGWVKRWTVE